MIIKCLRGQLATILKKGDIVNKFIFLAESPNKIQEAEIVTSDIYCLKKVFFLKKIWKRTKIKSYSKTIPKNLFFKNTFSLSCSNN